MIILLILASVQFTSIVDFMVVMPLAPQLELTLGIDAARFGLVVASYTLSAGLAGLLASTVLDRFGRRRAYPVALLRVPGRDLALRALVQLLQPCSGRGS